MLATIASATLLGVVGTPVTVEVHVSSGLPGFTIVGLPDTSCREARDRVRAALLSSGLRWPQRRVTVNLAPTGVRKSGAGLDLAIAIGLLVADEQIPAEVAGDVGFIGELGPRRRHPPGGRRAAAGRRAVDRGGRGAAGLGGRGPAGGPPRRAGGRVADRAAGQPLRRRAVAGAAVAARPAPAARPARPLRRPRPGPRPPRPRGGGRRRAPPADDRFARVGQDDAGPASGRSAPRSRPGRRARDDPGALGGGGRAAAGRAGPAPAVPCPAPRRVGGGHRRRGRGAAPAGRDLHRPQRRALPRRDGRVPRRRARRAAPAARGGRRSGWRGPACGSRSRRASCWSAR